MNQRTAKLLRRYAIRMKLPYRRAKHAWLRIPRPLRGEARKALLHDKAL